MTSPPFGGYPPVGWPRRLRRVSSDPAILDGDTDSLSTVGHLEFAIGGTEMLLDGVRAAVQD